MHPERRAVVLAAVAAIAGGALISVQGRMNGELSRLWHAPLDAAVWSFVSGFTVLCLLMVLPRPRRALADLWSALRQGQIRWWQCLGGMLGAMLVAVQTYAVPLVGVAVFTVAVVAGQTSSGLAVDRIGLSPTGRVPVNRQRLIAAGLAVLGAAVASTARGGQSTVLWVPIVLAAAVGVTFAVQLAINGHVNLRTAYPLSTTWLNFATGLVMLGVISLIRLVVGGGSAQGGVTGAPWWAWFGGICGIGAVVAASSTVRTLGVLILAIATLTGQLGAALVLDLTTAVGRAEVGWQLVGGVLVTFAAAALAGLSRRPRRTGGSAQVD